MKDSGSWLVLVTNSGRGRIDAPGPRGRITLIKSIAVAQLQLDRDSVFEQRTYGFVDLRAHAVHSRALLYPIPAGLVGTILILANPDPFHSGIEKSSPPAADPRKARIAGQRKIHAESIRQLGGTTRRHLVRNARFKRRDRFAQSENQ